MKKMMDSTTVIITTTDNRVLLQKRDENPDIEYSGYYSPLIPQHYNLTLFISS